LPPLNEEESVHRKVADVVSEFATSNALSDEHVILKLSLGNVRFGGVVHEFSISTIGVEKHPFIVSIAIAL